jgi:hypothetical protein
MAQRLNRRSSAGEGHVQAQSSVCGVVVEKITLGEVFLPVNLFSLLSISPRIFNTH